MKKPAGSSEPALPLPLAADLQDHLLIACHDLDRLHDLLADASGRLLHSFRGALDSLGAPNQACDGEAPLPAVAAARARLGEAIAALQFQDLTSQLIRHTQSRLRNCADRIACEILEGGDGKGAVEPPLLAPNPVAQAGMDAGSVELF